jgi:ribulose-bisphosphate carboxylase large chain
VSALIEATYLIETPLDPEKVAQIIAGEQSCGTFVRVASETDELRERAAAKVLAVAGRPSVSEPTLASDWLQRNGIGGPYRRAEIRIGFPPGNVGANLATLAATTAGNLYDLGEVTGLKLLSLTLPADYRARFPFPSAGIGGTRDMLRIDSRPLFGTIIKPNVGLQTEQIADLVEMLCEAGVDFVKDDEVAADPAYAPLHERIPAVMSRVRAYRERAGRDVMVAFNVTDEVDAMRRHADLIAAEGGSCAMVSMNWVGLSGLQTLRASTPLALHGHRNGYGGFARHPALGIAFPAYQTLYRLTGIDHLHVHGIGGKFADSAEEVAEAARLCCRPLTGIEPERDRVFPVFSSGQWAGTLPETCAAAGSRDLIFLSGGGILAHPDGPSAGVASLRHAWEACAAGQTLAQRAESSPPLAHALAFFGRSR